MAEVAEIPVSDVVDAPVIPSVPSAPEAPTMSLQEATERLKVLSKITRPPMDEHQTRVNAINDEIRVLKEKTEDLRHQMEEAKQARVGSRTEWSEAMVILNQLKAEKDVFKQSLEAVRAERTAAKDKFDALKSKKRAMQSETKHSSIDEVDVAIRKLEHRQQTVSMSLQEEKKLLKEIQALKDSKNVVSQLGGQEEVTRTAMELLDGLKKVENDKWTEYKEANEKYKAQMSVLDEIKAQQGSSTDPYQDLLVEKKALHEEIGAKMDARSILLKEFKEANEVYGKSVREIRQLKDLIKQIELEARRTAFLERKRLIEEEEAKKIPYEEEMVLCDQLVSYLSIAYKPKAGVKEETSSVQCCAPDKDLFEGKSLVIKKRDETDFFAGKGLKKGKSGRRSSLDSAGGSRRGSLGVGKGDIVTHGMSTIESFAMLGLEAPGTKTEIDASIEELRAKKEWYSKQPRGSVPKAGSDNRNKREYAGSAAKKNSGENGAQKGPSNVPEMTEEAFPLLPGAVPKVQIATIDVDAETDEQVLDDSALADQALAEAEAAQALAEKEMEEAAKDAAELAKEQAAESEIDLKIDSLDDINDDGFGEDDIKDAAEYGSPKTNDS